MRSRSIGFAVPFALFPSACGPEREEAQGPATGEPVQSVQPNVMALDTTPEAVWAHLEEVRYQETWTFWPDREPYYRGTEPHGAAGIAAAPPSLTRTDEARGSSLLVTGDTFCGRPCPVEPALSARPLRCRDRIQSQVRVEFDRRSHSCQALTN